VSAALRRLLTICPAGCWTEQANGAISGVRQVALKEDYIVYFSADVGATVSALIGYVESHGDALVDLRVERPSLEDRFLEITNTGGTP